MTLTDQEKQDVVRHIEAGRPLPDKYRFLLFEDKREVELVWSGKTDAVTNVVLPFQTIEQIDEPRRETSHPTPLQADMFSTDARGRQLKGWTNKLIWGDNKLVLSSLKNGPMREEIERQGGIKLIYIDPPFDVGADFTMNVEVGGETIEKQPNVLEEVAYRDTWGSGIDSYAVMIYERVSLMRDLLAEDGSILVHCDYRLSGTIRQILDEIFGAKNLVNELIWHYRSGGGTKSRFGRKHDTIFFYSKTANYTFDSDSEFARVPHNAIIAESRRNQFDTRGMMRPDVLDISRPPNHSSEWVGYPTQKPLSLIDTLVGVLCPKDGIVADFFCGSGTIGVSAEKLGRKWIASDLGKFAIHTTRKRLIGVQRALKAEGKDYRAFEILNLGTYERQHFVGVNADLRDEERAQQLAAKEGAFVDLILRAYKAERVTGFPAFQGKRAGRMVAVGPVNLPVTQLFVEAIMLECRKHHVTKVDILGFEFEMGLFPNLLQDARTKGIDIAPRHIPREVFDKRAVERGQVTFHDVAFIDAKVHVKAGAKGAQVAVELTDFSVFYQQDSAAGAEVELKAGKSRVVIDAGQVVKVTKDKTGVVTRELLTAKWTDWIDYWSVDFDFESKREIIRVADPESGETEERWTGDYVFENEWQSFRTRRDRSLELKSVFHEAAPGRRRIAVKVVDIFGNDTMTIIETDVPDKTGAKAIAETESGTAR